MNNMNNEIKARIKELKLTPKQLRFCELYATDREFFGNGVQSYAGAYNIDLSQKKGYNTARANSSALLTNTDIMSCINLLFEAHGLNDTFVDKQLERLIIQDADFKTKLGAIKEYNSIKGRNKNNLDITSNGDQLRGVLVEFAKPVKQKDGQSKDSNSK